MTPIGPVVNLTSGIAEYPWPAFFVFDVAGELMWVLLYVMLGNAFSDQVQTLSAALGNFTWVIVGLAAMGFLARMLWSSARSPESSPRVHSNAEAADSIG